MMSPRFIITQIVGGLGLITFNRPQALNALSLPMVRELTLVLRAWASDAAVLGVLLRGSARPAAEGKHSQAHFCAGGDIRFMHEAALCGDPAIDDFFTEEYALDHLIHTYPKPMVAWMEGIAMGGGMGLAQGCTLKVATETVRMAMPETRIGLFPDVAGGYFLSHCPGSVGEYLGLVGPHLNAADALAVGLADEHARADSLPLLLDGLTANPAGDAAVLVERIMDHIEAHPVAELPAPTVSAHVDRIDRHFSLASVAEIMASLAQDPSDWARETLHHMAGHSPLMMCVALEQIRRARHMLLADEFRMERDIVRHCFSLRKGAASETVEGVRALVIDKDLKPRWNPPTVAEVTPDMVAAFFEPVWPEHAHPLRGLS